MTTVVDLFAGLGGWSAGAEMAGNAVPPIAAVSASQNLPHENCKDLHESARI